MKSILNYFKITIIFSFSFTSRLALTIPENMVELEKLNELHTMFAPELSYLSPLNGFLALKGLLANIRFYGNYGPIK